MGLDPMIPNDIQFRFAEEEVFSGSRSWTISYAVSTGALGQVTFELTEDLLNPGLWRSNGLAPVSLRREGPDDLIKLRLPEGSATNRMLFLRMKTE